MSDGTLIFDTKIDTTGLKNGLAAAGKIGEGALSVLGTGAAAVAAGATAAAGAVGVLAKQSVSAYADYEQLVGGVDTLFKDASQQVQNYAKQSYEATGLSANEYMETVTGFSASLIQSLGGNTERAAELANQAIIDMSDNANKMGSDMESIQNAYAGFAKQNYTMLDNLKLGYGGTKEEMERLLKDAQAISGIEYNISSYADVVSAIHVIQKNMSIAGTTAKEASTTISGSLGMLKSAWQDMLTGFANGDANIYELFSNVTKSLEAFLSNLTPRIQRIVPQVLNSIDTLFVMLVNAVAPMLGPVLNELVPQVLEAAIGLIETLIELLSDNLDSIVEFAATIMNVLIEGFVSALPLLLEMAAQLVGQLVMAIVEQAPQLIEVAFQLINTLCTGIGSSLPELIPKAIEIVLQICTTLIDNLPLLIDAALQLFVGIVTGLIQAIPVIIQALPQLIESILVTLGESSNLIIDAGYELFVALIANLPTIIIEIVKAVPQIVGALVRGFISLAGNLAVAGVELIANLISGIKSMMSPAVSAALDIGKSLVDGLWSGIKSGWDWLTTKVGELASSLFSAAKKALDINSPSKKFRWIGEMCVAGFDEGIEDLMDGSSLGAAVNASLSTVRANTSEGVNGGAGSSQTFNFYDTQTSPDAIRRKFDNTMTFGLAGGV